MYCHYLDNSLIDLRTVAERSKCVKKQPPLPSCEDQIILKTCQRIEVISSSPVDQSLLERIFRHLFAVTEGQYNIFRQWVEISCGLRSQTLGEQFFYRQVQRSVDTLSPNSPLAAFAKAALTAACELRKFYNFYAPINNVSIVFSLVAADESEASCDSPLIIIGAGMLGEAVSASPHAYGYKQSVLLSRTDGRINPRRFGNSVAYALDRMPQELLQRFYRSFIASENITDEYEQCVLELLSNPITTSRLCNTALFNVVEVC